MDEWSAVHSVQAAVLWADRWMALTLCTQGGTCRSSQKRHPETTRAGVSDRFAYTTRGMLQTSVLARSTVLSSCWVTTAFTQIFSSSLTQISMALPATVATESCARKTGDHPMAQSEACGVFEPTEPKTHLVGFLQILENLGLGARKAWPIW